MNHTKKMQNSKPKKIKFTNNTIINQNLKTKIPQTPGKIDSCAKIADPKWGRRSERR
jgi:hypothetical protein